MPKKIDGEINIPYDPEDDIANIEKLPPEERKYAVKYLGKSTILNLKMILYELWEGARAFVSRGFINRGKPGRPSYPEDLWVIDQIKKGRNTTDIKKEWFEKIDMSKRDPNQLGTANLERQFRKLVERAMKK